MIVFALTFRWSIHVCNTFEKKKIIDGHDGQYTCVIIILLKKKIVARRSTVRWLSLLWYFDGQYTCVIDKKKKNCRWSWWSIHLRNNYFIKKKNCRKKKHCSLIVFALIFWWSIHVCNRLKKKKNCRWSWWSIHLRNIYFIKKKNRRKRKHCSVIVFALIFRWSIHVCNRLKKKKIWWIGHDGQYTCVIFILFKKKIVARRSTVRWLSLLWYFDDQYTCVIDLKKKKIGDGHDGQYTCVIFIL